MTKILPIAELERPRRFGGSNRWLQVNRVFWPTAKTTVEGAINQTYAPGHWLRVVLVMDNTETPCFTEPEYKAHQRP
jgi:hypothetical protein